MGLTWGAGRFVEAESESPPAVRMVLRLIGQLYRNESDCDQKRYSPKLRAYRRLVLSASVLKRIEKIVKKLQMRARPKSQLGKACSYLLGQMAGTLTNPAIWAGAAG